MERALGRPPLASKIFGGRIIIDELDAEDRERTEVFAKRQGMPFKDVNVMAEKEVDEFIEDVTAKIAR